MLWRRVGIDPETESVHNNVMMKPAERGEVVCLVITTVAPHSDVMSLEPVARMTPGDRAPAIAVGDETAHLGRDGPGPVRGNNGFAVFETDELHASLAQNAVQHGRADPGTKLDFGSQLPMEPGLGCVKEHGHQRLRTPLVVAVAVNRFPGVLADRDQSVGPALRPSLNGTREITKLVCPFLYGVSNDYVLEAGQLTGDTP